MGSVLIAAGLLDDLGHGEVVSRREWYTVPPSGSRKREGQP